MGDIGVVYLASMKPVLVEEYYSFGSNTAFSGHFIYFLLL